MCVGNGTTTIDNLFNQNLTISLYNIMISIMRLMWGMKIILSSSRLRHVARAIIFLIVIALVAGMVGCVGVEYDVTITSTTGGSVNTPGEGTFTYDEGEVVELVAAKDVGYRFVNWTGDVDTIANTNAMETIITMNGHYSITANFDEILLYSLTISSMEGGSVTTPGEGVLTYEEGAVVNLVATPEAGYQFLNWTGDVDGIANVNDATTTITMNGDCSLKANFEAGGAVTFADPNLEAAIREAIDIPGRPIYPSDLKGLTSLFVSESNISDLSGLEHCVNLTELDLTDNQISDVASLASLTNLTKLWLDGNQIGNISALVQNEGLDEGDVIYLQGNPLSWHSINVCIPELKGRGVIVVYDEHGITGEVTVIPDCEGTMAEYTITFNITADLHSGVHSITILFPEGTTVPKTGWQSGDITVNNHDVFGVEVTVVATKVTFLVPHYIASGTVTVIFKEYAGIVNPPAGSYYLYVNTNRTPDTTPMRLGPY
jgi:hypothetical protein